MKTNKLHFACVALFAAILSISAFADDSLKRGPANESLRLEKTPAGYMVALRALPLGRLQYLDVTIKLTGYDTKQGAFLAVGMGDLYRFLNGGQALLGEGYLVGANNDCPAKGIALTLESYTAPGLSPDCAMHSIGPLYNNAVYQIRTTLFKSGEIVVSLHNETGDLLGSVGRARVALAAYERGIFLVPIGQGSYELLSLTAGSE